MEIPKKPNSKKTARSFAAKDDFALDLRQKFNRAVSAKATITADLERALRAYKGVYSNCGDLQFDGIDIWSNLTASICRSASAYIKDILAINIESPWSIEPTPVPTVSDEVKAQSLEFLGNLLPVGTFEEISAFTDSEEYKNFVKETKNTALYFEKEYAANAAEKMTARVQDHMDEGGWDDAFSQFIDNFVLYRFAVLKGAEVTNKQVLDWSNSRESGVKVTTKPILTVSAPDPFMIFWSAGARDIKKADVFEIMPLSRDDLLAYKGMEGEVPGAIDEVINEYPDGYLESRSGDGEQEALETDMLVTGSNDNQFYEAVESWITVTGAQLKVLKVSGKWEDTENVHIAVIRVGDDIINVRENPDPLGLRPYHMASYASIPNSMVGMGVFDLMADVQDLMNSATRALVKNLSYSSGPIGEYDARRLEDEDDPQDVQPYRLMSVNPDYTGTGQAAIRFYSVPSTIQEMRYLINELGNEAQERTGITRVLMGQTGGALGRTAAGAGMLLGAASKTVKLALYEIERRVLDPLVSDYVVKLMLYDPDKSIKGDIMVVVRGITGILNAETKLEKQLQFLQIVGSVLQPGQATPLVQEIGERMGVDTRALGMPDPNARIAQFLDAWEAGRKSAGGQQGGAGMFPGLQGGGLPVPAGG